MVLLDTHCHTAEGSPDSYIGVHKMIDILKSKGYNGALLTDHNSYKGYEVWKQSGRTDFTILRGVEYDTKDAGHMLIVLPSKLDCDIFTIRGMLLQDVLKIVHKLGGIVGPAHPFDYYRLGICNNSKWLQHLNLLHKFDFVEGFNACGREQGNYLAKLFGEYLELPMLGGSDSHRPTSVGYGGTRFEEDIATEDDLIEAIKAVNPLVTIQGNQFEDSALIKHKVLYGAGLRGYCLLNAILSVTGKKKVDAILETLGVV